VRHRVAVCCVFCLNFFSFLSGFWLGRREASKGGGGGERGKRREGKRREEKRKPNGKERKGRNGD